MNRHRIRTSETDSVRGIVTTQNVDVNLKQTTKNLPFPNISTTLSQRSVYEEERQAGNKFRLILTIVPYCTNVLFNALTEIIKNEGSDEPTVVTDATPASGIQGVYGLPNPSRVDMISNTEYSSPKHGGYEYHPGYDFFDNHIFRNVTFKIVNWNQNNNKEVFNTLGDFMRDRNGEIIKYKKRSDISSNPLNGDKHLYLKEDILPIDESINQNLYEENGWWGFLNNSTVDAKIVQNCVWNTMDISHILNNHKSCEFIDMYPDRSLFSFTPKFNKYKHREENNWNVVVTYPYKNEYNHPICYGGQFYYRRFRNSDGTLENIEINEGDGDQIKNQEFVGGWTGLKVREVTLGSGKIGSKTLSFRTYTRHGLSQQDTFYIYYTNPYLNVTDKYSNTEGAYYESEKFYKVTNVGDLNKNNDEYYFYISNLDILSEIYESCLLFVKDKIDKGVLTSNIPLYEFYNSDDKSGIYDENGNLKATLQTLLNHTNFRVRRCVSGVRSKYYLRIFRKVPNFRAKHREMTDEEKLHISKFNQKFDNYIKENAADPNNSSNQRLINNEQYQMAFAANIYNDNVAQISFMDGIDVKDLTDNLGRPLSQLYYTVVKNNAGYKYWYEGNTNESDIEFSHCFGKVTSGLDYFVKRDDDTMGDYLKKISSARHITNITNKNGAVKADTNSKNLDGDITYTNTFFYGDLVEFNAFDFKENVLSDVMHRFNTAQRELVDNKRYSQYQYHEILTDDYDNAGFEIKEYTACNGVKDSTKKEDHSRTTTDYQTIARPEGYIYKAHYPIQIREESNIKQDSHYTLRVRYAKPVQREGILIEVKTTLQHNLFENDIIYVCDDDNDIRYITRCVKTIDKTTFLMSPKYDEIVNNISEFNRVNSRQNTDRYNWVELCDILNGKYANTSIYPNLVLRRKNNKIPDYATYIGGNQYIWREMLNIGDSRIQELSDYIFANGYYYITQTINFYLKRQDPYGNNGLFFDDDTNYPYFPSDPSGVLQKENNFITKDTSVVC